MIIYFDNKERQISNTRLNGNAQTESLNCEDEGI